MVVNIDFNKIWADTKQFFNDLPNNLTKWMNQFSAWLNSLPEKIKNYPPDKQAAVGAIGFGSLLVIISLFMFIF